MNRKKKKLLVVGGGGVGGTPTLLRCRAAAVIMSVSECKVQEEQG